MPETLARCRPWCPRPSQGRPHTHPTLDVSPYQVGTGRELFAGLRQRVSGAEQGAMTFGWTEQGET